MNEKQQTATLAVFTDLRAAERAHNHSVRAHAQLIVTMIDGHEQADLHFEEGQDALTAAQAALACGIEGRGKLARSHRQLAVLAGHRGFDWSMAGDAGSTQPDEYFAPRGAAAAHENATV